FGDWGKSLRFLLPLVAMLPAPGEPSFGHQGHIPRVRRKNRLSTGNGSKGIEPMVGFRFKFPQNKWDDFVSHRDDLLIRRMLGHFGGRREELGFRFPNSGQPVKSFFSC